MGKRRPEEPERLVRLRLPPSFLRITTRPVSSARLERLSYKQEVEGSIPSPAITSGRGSSRARAWARATVERQADYRRPAPSNF